MNDERIKGSIVECKRIAASFNDEFSSTFRDVKVFCLNIQINLSNLQQSEADKATVVEIGKYILTNVCEPLENTSTVVENFVHKIEELYFDNNHGIELIFEASLETASSLIVELKCVKKQAKYASVSMKLHNAHVGGKMSKNVDEIDDIIHRMDSIIATLQEEIQKISELLDSVVVR